MLYTPFRDFLTVGLAETAWENVLFVPGPEVPAVPSRFVLLTRFGGPGYTTEGLVDGIGWQIRVAGEQNDYADAEGLSDHLDRWLLREGYSRTIGGIWVSDIRREGSPPIPLLVDDADRHHFVCSYIVDTSTE